MFFHFPCIFSVFSSNFPLLDPDPGGKLNADPDPYPQPWSKSSVIAQKSGVFLPMILCSKKFAGRFLLQSKIVRTIRFIVQFVVNSCLFRLLPYNELNSSLFCLSTTELTEYLQTVYDEALNNNYA